MMGGGGSIDAMAKSIKYNLSQLKKHRKSYKHIAETYSFKGRPINYKRATKEEIAFIRKVYEEKRRKQTMKHYILLAFVIFLSGIGMAVLFI
ncbi:MAG: hypothetical protein CMP59_06850 [Flavobacteriales bacterium]|nr:hypothetical protein [Flavobacteriales bacterium]